MTRIYTKTGDDGTTGLIGGQRVHKDASRIEAYGVVDELNAVFGVVCASPLPERVRPILRRVQDDLFTIGADLALPAGMDRKEWGVPAILDENIAGLEREIDECQSELPQLQRFILPGGSAPGAMLHLARTVARRAERRCVALAHAEPVDPQIIRYLNRLSDLCFVLARYVNHKNSQPETPSDFRESRIGVRQKQEQPRKTRSGIAATKNLTAEIAETAENFFCLSITCLCGLRDLCGELLLFLPKWQGLVRK